MAGSDGGIGEEMDEWVCAVTMTSLHKARKTVNSDKGDSDNREGASNPDLSKVKLILPLGGRHGLEPTRLGAGFLLSFGLRGI